MGDIYTNPPQSRNEAILRATIDGTEYEAPPQSRMEDLLLELKAAIEQGGGIGNYNDLNNKPKINSVTLQGNQSISDLFDGKVDIGVDSEEESGYAELKDENGDRIFRASSANGGASVESGALIGQPGALVLYNGEGGVSSVRPKGGVIPVEVDLPAENGTLALDSQIASSQTPPKAAVVTVPDAAPINAEDITVDITPVQLGSGTPSPDNIRPIEGRTGAELDRVGKNLLDPTIRKYLNPFVIYGGTISSNVPDGSLVLTAGTYTISINKNMPTIDVRDNPNSAIKTGQGNNLTFTLEEEKAIKIAINIGSADIDSLTFQLERGSTATAYEPYQGKQYTADFGETVYGGKWHVTDGGTDKTVGLFDMPTTWQLNAVDNQYWLLTANAPYSMNVTNQDGVKRVISEILDGVSADFAIANMSSSIYTSYIALISRNRLYVKIPKSAFQTIEDFSQYLADNPCKLAYELATPTTISTPKQNVPMLKGINTVYADCGDTQLKYQPDNVIGELKGEIQEVESELDKLDKAYMTSDTFSERGIDGEYQITRIGNEIHVAAVIDDASIATQTGSVDLIADLPDEFKCNPSYGAVLALRHSSGTGKIEFKLHPGITQSFYMYVEEVNTTSGVWFPIYDVPGKAL